MDGKVSTAKLVEALALEENAFRMGISKVMVSPFILSAFVVKHDNPL